MRKSISIIDKDYKQWVKTLVVRYRQSQIKAAVKVNSEQLMYNFMLGRDIVEMHVEERWGESVINQLSIDLKREMPTAEGLSATNLRYCRRFYLLYSKSFVICPQVEGKLNETTDTSICPQTGGVIQASTQSLELSPIFNVPWGHHKLIMDKVKGDVNKALFYIGQTLENGWSRSLLLNWIDTGLYERQGKAITNFKSILPAPDSDLTQEITKDPYNFAFAGITKRHNEAELKLAFSFAVARIIHRLNTHWNRAVSL